MPDPKDKETDLGQDPNPDDDDKSKGGGQDPGKKPPADTLTPDRFKATLKAQADENKAALDAQKKGFEEKLDGLTSKLDEAIEKLTKKPDGDDPDDKDKKTETEIGQLKRQIADLEKKRAEADEKVSAAEKRELENQQKAIAYEALEKAGCNNVRLAYIDMLDRRTVVYEDSKVFVDIKNDVGGTERFPIEEFVVKYTREEDCPELFKGGGRGGAPASGDDSGGGGHMEFDYNKVRDKPDILKSEKFRKALAAGKVANVGRQTA